MKKVSSEETFTHSFLSVLDYRGDQLFQVLALISPKTMDYSLQLSVKIDYFSPTYPRKVHSHLSSYDVFSPPRYNSIVVTNVTVSLVKTPYIEHLPYASDSPRYLTILALQTLTKLSVHLSRLLICQKILVACLDHTSFISKSSIRSQTWVSLILSPIVTSVTVLYTSFVFALTFSNMIDTCH